MQSCTRAMSNGGRGLELELGSSQSGKSNTVKSTCSDGQGSQLETIKSLPESEFKYEGASAEAILQALEEKTKPKPNEIAAFTQPPQSKTRRHAFVRVHP